MDRGGVGYICSFCHFCYWCVCIVDRAVDFVYAKRVEEERGIFKELKASEADG